MSRVWGRVALLGSPVLCAGKFLGRAGPGWDLDAETPDGAKAPKSHLRASGAAERPSPALALMAQLEGRGWRCHHPQLLLPPCQGPGICL